MRKQNATIIFRDTRATKEKLRALAGPYGDLSKVARVAIREGIRALEKHGGRGGQEVRQDARRT